MQSRRAEESPLSIFWPIWMSHVSVEGVGLKEEEEEEEAGRKGERRVNSRRWGIVMYQVSRGVEAFCLKENSQLDHACSQVVPILPLEPDVPSTGTGTASPHRSQLSEPPNLLPTLTLYLVRIHPFPPEHMFLLL